MTSIIKLGKNFISQQSDVSIIGWKYIKTKIQKLYQKENGLILTKDDKRLLDYDTIIGRYNTQIQEQKNIIQEKRDIKYAQVIRNKQIKMAREVRREAKDMLLGKILNFADEYQQEKKKNNMVTMPITRLDKYLQYKSKINKVPLNKPFSIEFSSIIADIKHVFKFNHVNHFRNFLEKLSNEEEDSAGNKINKQKRKDLFGGKIGISNIISVAGGCNTNKAGEKCLKSSFYNYKLHNPFSRNNNCFFACVKYLTNQEVDVKKLRRHFNLETGEMVSIGMAYDIIQYLAVDVEIISYDTNEELSEDKMYLVYKDSHFSALVSFESIMLKDKKTKRGTMTFDFETRKSERYRMIKASETKSFYLKDSICGVTYTEYKKETVKKIMLVTNKQKSSARQFIDFLNKESESNRSYNVMAHNGARFDFYFIIACMTSIELTECDVHFRGTSIIGINYRRNLFKDSCCFMPSSLADLSESFKVQHGKITEMMLHGSKISSGELCFYKNELSFDEFMDLENTDKEFWKLYVEYCFYDCLALKEIWSKFTDCVNSLVGNISPHLLKTCPLMSSNTIGSHSKKILVEMNNFKGKSNWYKTDLELFTGITMRGDKKIIDSSKYEFLCNFKRGGISHCHQPGKHMTGTCGVDIASQYPAALIRAYIPTGFSSWTNIYKEKKYGFYHIANIKFTSKYNLRPVAKSIQGKSLDWSPETIDELYIDGYMIDYLIEKFGMTFDVITGLVSNKQVAADKIFGNYISSFYEEKKRQDALKEAKHVDYNEALRSVIKLYLNSLTGKLVEDPSIHFSTKFDDTSSLKLNGTGIRKVFNKGSINEWLICGIMVYSYSKRLLFEYIDCLPNRSDDVIHIETDGIYFSSEHLATFRSNLASYSHPEYPCKLGDDLGNLKIEKVTPKGQVSYFLGKKFYNITFNNKFITYRDENGDVLEEDSNGNKISQPRDKTDKAIYRIKGIPQSTLNADGSKKYIVDTSLYEKIYSGESVKSTFSTLQKSLFKEETSITTHDMTRITRPNFTSYGLFESYNTYQE
jgi:DNA polymerase type B, organellar and viral